MVSLDRLRTLTLILSSDCNLRCAYCFENAKHPGRMSWPIMRRALNLLLASSRQRVNVLFTGGEPTLEFALLGRATRYLEARARGGHAIRSTLITNGTLLDGPRARFLAAHDFRVQMSVDGIAEAQSFRGRDTWTRLDALLSRIRRDHPRWFRNQLSVAITVHPRTIPFLAESVEYLIAKDVRDIRIAAACGLRQPWQMERVAEIEAQISRAARSCVRHLERTRRVPVDLFRIRPQSRESPLPDRLCGAGNPHYIAVDVDGEVSACAVLVRSFQRFPPTPLGRSLAMLHRGRIESPTLAQDLARSAAALLETGLVDNRDQKYSSYGRCRTCGYAGECVVCPASIGCEPGNRDPDRIPDFQCAFNRAAARVRRRFPSLYARANK